MTSTERVGRSSLAIAFALAVASSAMLASSPAFAKNPEAVEHFELGRKQVRENRWQDAATEFEKSLALEQAVGPMLNLANAYEKLGRLASAARTFRAAQKLASQTPGDQARAAEAAGRARELEEKVPTISLTADANVSLEIRGVGVVQRDAPTAIDPGRHTITATAPGKRPRTLEVVVAARDRLKVVVPSLDEPLRVDESPSPSPSPSESHPPSTETPTSSSTSTTEILAYAAAGTGVVALAVGGAFGLVAASDKSDLEGLCPRYPTCPSANANAAHEADDSLGRNATISTVGFVAGGVLIATGIALYFFAPRSTTTATIRNGNVALTF
jgi:hypothetical protein